MADRASSRSLTEPQITDSQESVLRWLAPGPFSRLGTVRHRWTEPEPAWGHEQPPHQYGSAARPRALGPRGCGEFDIGRARGLRRGSGPRSVGCFLAGLVDERD